MSRTLSRVVPAAVPAGRPARAEDVLSTGGRIDAAGFFPGLGSRAHYRGLGRTLLDSGLPEVAGIYHEAARVLGFADRPDRLLLTPGTLPEGPMERQGLIGAALLVHSLALDAYLRARAARAGVPLRFVAYTGESFGILAAAVAGGSLPLAHGVRIAHAFTPLMLLAADARGADEPFARQVARYLPESVRHAPLVPEPSHVVAVEAPDPEALAAVVGAIRATYQVADAELHKTYSPTQANVYVRAGTKPAFDRFMADHPRAAARELKDPTVFLAHSARMRPAREALKRFLEAHRIRFAAPRVPVVSNHDASLLTTAADIRRAVLAMTDRVMASQETCAVLDGLGADAVLELGPGGKSVQLLRDNHVATPVTAYTGGAEETGRLLHTVDAVRRLLGRLDDLRATGGEPARAHTDTAREALGLAAASAFGDALLTRALGRAVGEAAFGPGREEDPPGFRGFLEVLQHTHAHRGHVAADRGELVTRARLKKRIDGAEPALLGHALTELRTVDRSGTVRVRTVDTGRAEVVVFHLGGLAALGDTDVARRIARLLEAEPEARLAHDRMREDLGADLDGGMLAAGRRIIHQYLLHRALVRHRPALTARTDHYFEGGDADGWLAALALSGALSLADAVALRTAHSRGDGIELLLDAVTGAGTPLVSPEGVPVHSRRDLQDATRAVLDGGALDGVRRIHLNGDCQVVALGPGPDAPEADTRPFRVRTVRVGEVAEAARKGLNPALDEAEYACLLALTEENSRVLETARGRRVLSSTVQAYIRIDESVVGFGKGGSESMTVFVRKDGEQRVTVRKILSEALTTARWHADGSGVMLPPFAKARKQAEFLQALPASVRGLFPEVFTVLERELPVPAHLRKDGRAVDREVVYEMSYVEGEEVSRFVEKHSPPPAVVARLYEQIIRVLNEDVHSVGRTPAPGETLDTSYFRKIEDRLALCRRTAPRTFDAHLLDTPRIVIDGVSYLNSSALLERFRAAPEYLAVLEPAFHSLVMGDTNTENIKIGDTGPLLHAQRLIDSGAPQADVDAALAAITAASLGIRFLDPRAIGFKGEGRDTRDDAMYDNKPWHNSIGHYDEIHFEHFTLTVDTGAGRTPVVEIEFTEGNPYQRAYRVRDVTAFGGTVDRTAPDGMEDRFAAVMTAALGLDDPGSPYLAQDPYWLVRFVFMMGQHFTAMPPFHFQKELDGTLLDTYRTQRRPVAIYCEGVKWLNWALQMLEGTRTEFLGLPVPPMPHLDR